MANAYAKAGVDVNAGYEVVERIKKHVKKTERLGVMGALGGFGGCFDLSGLNIKEPVLISGTDGVGTKLMVAFKENKHDTIGIDCVAMCVNDIVAQGAEPLYFLDYLATGKNDPERLEQVVAGVAAGCLQAGAALIGGETAEMPGMYAADEYDLAGFAVGVAEKSQLITGENIKVGDILIGLPASGIHSNGFSLVRKIFFTEQKLSGSEKIPMLGDKTLGESLLTPTKIYVNALLPLIKENLVNGIAHITGGGFVENIPRMLPMNVAAEITEGTWPVLPIFDVMQEYGQIDHDEMFEIFNMGIGMVLALSPDKVAQVKAILAELDEPCYEIGQVVVAKPDAPLITISNEGEK
ncbi:phosphoribosylformylglycinamidine cyclo-ligase [Enterococcus saigonensis]|uniref:Phosphoribosylformylglycinamidine cyclo-ligase n=1 Tax=Enterococcus saigonensis TaxID=1805431 RepID=A0A679IMJ5_9ENTE|nr:phosphoribosylformylglycinamidine cyclo-ligase [Enterococcus saigonensis]BCA85991.1 phosphoribosylformylglycinamidine cyclo-ligase [Enterococcus saigonensis]